MFEYITIGIVQERLPGQTGLQWMPGENILCRCVHIAAGVDSG